MSSAPMPSSRSVLYVAGVAAIVAAGWFAVSAVQYRQQRWQVARMLTHGNPDAAPVILRRYGCAGCHTIPGISGADGQVGPDLSNLRKRVYIGGVANNTADNLVRWIVSPQSLSPRSAMPATGISESEARDVAAYLYAH